MPHPRRMRRVIGVLAIAAGAVLAAPGVVAAQPADRDHFVATPESAVLGASADLVEIAEPSDLLGLLEAANASLRAVGVQPFLYPTFSPFCNSEGGLPLGIVPAVAGAAPGPWPTPISVPGIDLTPVKPGETLYALIPAGITTDSDNKSGMHLAWFNTTTSQGGLAELGDPTVTVVNGILSGVPAELREAVKPSATSVVQALFAQIPLQGVRMAAVPTGKGTILSVMFGTVSHKSGGKDATCFFIPTIGLTEAK